MTSASTKAGRIAIAALETGKRVGVAIEPLQRAAANEDRIRGARVDARGFRRQTLGIVEARRPEMQQAEREQRVEISWIGVEDVAIETRCFGQVARVLGEQGLLQQLPHASTGVTAKCAGGSPF